VEVPAGRTLRKSRGGWSRWGEGGGPGVQDPLGGAGRKVHPGHQRVAGAGGGESSSQETERQPRPTTGVGCVERTPLLFSILCGHCSAPSLWAAYNEPWLCSILWALLCTPACGLRRTDHGCFLYFGHCSAAQLATLMQQVLVHDVFS